MYFKAFYFKSFSVSLKHDYYKLISCKFVIWSLNSKVGISYITSNI